MLLGIMGQMGNGKTLSMSMFGTYFAKMAKVPLYANYGLKDSIYVNGIDDIWKIDNAVLCLDELWLTMDARNWKDNVSLTRWINQTRKKRLLVLYTTQHINQIEMRVRKATDVLFYVQKVGQDHRITYVDYQYDRLGKTYILSNPQQFYKLYDTFEVLNPLKK